MLVSPVIYIGITAAFGAGILAYFDYLDTIQSPLKSLPSGLLLLAI